MSMYTAMNASLLAVFGETVTYGAASITAILRHPTHMTDVWPGEYLGLETSTDQLANADKGDSVTIGSTTYKVYQADLDAAGWWKLALAK